MFLPAFYPLPFFTFDENFRNLLSNHESRLIPTNLISVLFNRIGTENYFLEDELLVWMVRLRKRLLSLMNDHFLHWMDLEN